MSNYQYTIKILDEVKKQVVGMSKTLAREVGKDNILKLILCAFLSEGHVLIDDIPGVGKTTMAVAFENAMGLQGRRMQFTPDVLPSDILGFNIFDKSTQRMMFQPGAIFCNMFLADEINRTSPKTQSALLEAMEERQVTVDGVTRRLDRPFFVIATQNPVGSTGTQRLPESEMDRFMICVSMGYPTINEEREILRRKNQSLGNVEQVADKDVILEMMGEVRDVFVHEAIYDYMARLTNATRNHPMIELGGSPRASLALMHMSMALAYMNGRNYVLPDDVEEVFLPVLNHRILKSRKARTEKLSEEEILSSILQKEHKPTQKRA